MNRKNFLRNLGAAGIGLSLPASALASRATKTTASKLMQTTCTLIPSETAGPFPLDLSENVEFFRQDVTEGFPGTILNLKLKIIGTQNCLPMQNVRVNIWSCDKDGDYSGYGALQGQTEFRGYQWTDANGEVSFKTIVPGWYPGRVCHIHFQVWVSASYSAVSQLTFDSAVVNQAYAENNSVYTRGADPLTPETDGIFDGDYALQLATLTKDTTTGEYDSYLEIAVQGEGMSGVSHIERQAAKHVRLGQNSPNPFTKESTIPFELFTASKVRIDLYSLDGKIVYQRELGRLGVGQHEIPLVFSSLGVPAENYVYQLNVMNDEGDFKAVKMMTKKN